MVERVLFDVSICFANKKTLGPVWPQGCWLGVSPRRALRPKVVSNNHDLRNNHRDPGGADDDSAIGDSGHLGDFGSVQTERNVGSQA
jgi:hypothetical protein